MQTYIDESDGTVFEDFGDGFMVATTLDENGELEVFDEKSEGSSFVVTKDDVLRMLARFEGEV